MSWDGNGVGDYLQIANDSRLHFDGTDHCFGVWVRRDGNSNLSNNGPIFGSDGAGNLLHSLIIYSSTDGTNPNKTRFYVRDTAGNFGQIMSTVSIVNNVWTHFLVQRDGNIVTLYIDGVADGTVDVSSVAIEDPGVDLFLFSVSAAGGARHNGQLADFFKFDRALTSSEITDIAGGLRPTELRGALEQLAIFLPMDEDPLVAANMRDYHNRYVLSHSGMDLNSNHPDIYDPRPTVKTYYEQSTHRKVQFTGDTLLDVCRETPYGILAPTTDDISSAVNWCLKYQREPDPDSRVPAGGPVGCFTPVIPACGASEYWLSTGQWFNPSKWGNALYGERIHNDPEGAVGTNSNGGSRVRFNLTDKAMPCIINQGINFTMRDLAFVAHADEEVGLINHEISFFRDATLTTRTSDTEGVVTLDSATTFVVTGERVQIRWSGGARTGVVVDAIGGSNTTYTFSGGTGDNLPAESTAVEVWDWCYQPDNADGYGTGGIGTQFNSRLLLQNTAWQGFTTAAIQNGGYANESNCDHHTITEIMFRECARGWYNINDQGVNIEFAVAQWGTSSGSMFDFQAGGFMSAKHVLSTFSNSKLLNIGLGGALKRGPGKNNGYFRIIDFKTDTQAENGAWIVYMEGDSGTDFNRWCTIIIDGGANSRRANTGGSDQARNRFVRLVGRCSLTIEKTDFPGQIEIVGGDPATGSYAGSVFAPDIYLRRCQVEAEDAADPASTLLIGDTPNSFTVRDCFQNSGTTSVFNRPVPINDYESLGGAVVDIDYQTESEVNDLIDAADYTTPAEAQALVDAADYTTPAEAQALIEQYATYAAPETGASGSITWS